MTLFIIQEAIDTDSNISEEEQEEEEETNAQESNFIDENTLFSDQTPSDYRQVDLESVYTYAENVERSYEDAMAHMSSEDECVNDFFNFVFGSEPSDDVEDEFEEGTTSKNRIKKFEENLKQKCEKSKGSFFNAVLWDAYIKVKGKNATDFG